MPYRERAEVDRVEAARPRGAPLAVIEAVGAPGNPGAHGLRGAPGSGYGADGEPGRDAGPAEAGQAAGHIHLVLRDAGPGRVALGGSVRAADGSERSIEGEIDLGDDGAIALVARGGEGGRGGVGGRGGDGASGRPGSDATQWSSGGDGGPGGDGGRGGRGTSGARGGAGGTIEVEVGDDDTHLLMLPVAEVSGGEGGAPGENGRGGDGGAGGPGGSSHSWSETEWYTDSEGKSQTRSVSHWNPGGSNGRPGTDGHPGRAELVAGARGKDGRFSIRVKDGSGRDRTYASRYDLRLVGFELESQNGDGVFEPEEKVLVTNVAVENVGGMPTPSRREVRVALCDHGWLAAGREELVVPPGLEPGARHVFEGATLTATIGAYHPARPGDPLAAEEVVRHRAWVPDARREMPDYETAASAELGRFTVRFPLEAGPIESLCSLAPGDAARLRVRVTNASAVPYGREAPIGRVVAVDLGLHESELDAGALLFFDDTGARVDLEGHFRREIPLLGPGESVEIRGTIAVAEHAPAYRAGRVSLSLELGGLERPADKRPIQRRAFEVRVARPLRLEGALDELLVVNNRTTAEELAAWEALVAGLGLRATVLDLSLEGRLELDAAVGGGPSMARRLQDHALVVLASSLDTAEGPRLPARYLDKGELLRAACATGVLFHGEKLSLARLVTPSAAPSGEPPRAAGAWLEAIAKGADDGPAIGGPPVVLDAHGWTGPFADAPPASAIAERAGEVERALYEAWPGRRFVLVTRPAPKRVRDATVAQRWSLGTIEVHRTLDAGGAIVAATVPEAEVHDAARVLARDTALELALALPFREKLARLRALATTPGEGAGGLAGATLLEIVADAIVVDLANEALALARPGFCGAKRRRAIAAALRRLDALAGAFDDPPPALADAVVRIAARLDFVIAAEVRLWENLPPLLFLRRSTALRSLVRDRLDALVTRALGGPAGTDEGRAKAKAARRAIAAAKKALREEHVKARRQADGDLPLHTFARGIALAPAGRGERVALDAELFTEAESRVLGEGDLAAVRARDAERAAERAALMGASRRARDELASPLGTAALVARAAPRVRVAVTGEPVTQPPVTAADVAATDDGAWVDAAPREPRRA